MSVYGNEAQQLFLAVLYCLQHLWAFIIFIYLKRGDKVQEKILSVGIDIGTSTTQLVFSHITIENTASSF